MSSDIMLHIPAPTDSLVLVRCRNVANYFRVY